MMIHPAIHTAQLATASGIQHASYKSTVTSRKCGVKRFHTPRKLARCSSESRSNSSVGGGFGGTGAAGESELADSETGTLECNEFTLGRGPASDWAGGAGSRARTGFVRDVATMEPDDMLVADSPPLSRSAYQHRFA